jgi:GrpB-like predicted nucleotidyltransferase (UPF0157 family)
MRGKRSSRRIKVVGIQREEIDTEQIAMVLWLQAKRQIKERKDAEEQAAKEQADPSDYRYWDDEPVRVVSYDLAWPIRFEEEKRLLEAGIGRWVTGGIHHVGSTAVPGLAAKPVIDIMVGVEDLDSSRPASEPLTQLGYLYAPYREAEMHWFCKPDPAHRTHHLHLVPTGSRRYQDELVLRDLLHSNTRRSSSAWQSATSTTGKPTPMVRVALLHSRLGRRVKAALRSKQISRSKMLSLRRPVAYGYNGSRRKPKS